MKNQEQYKCPMLYYVDFIDKFKYSSKWNIILIKM